MDQILQEKLRTLRAKYFGSSESLIWLDGVESALRKLIEEKEMAQHPVFIDIVKDAQKRLNDINALLMNDDTLNDSRRSALFEARKVWRFNVDRFGMKTHDDAIKLLTVSLDDGIAQ